jgi:DNA polymerase delta subunit 1
MCYVTLIPQDLVKKFKKKKVKMTETPTGVYFVDESVRKGILPLILEEVVSSRKQVQEILNNCNDPFEAMVLEAR